MPPFRFAPSPTFGDSSKAGLPIVFFALGLPSSLVWAQSAAQTTQVLQQLSRTEPSAPLGDITLVTKNRNLEELGRELSRIYLTLYNSRRLSVRPAFWHVAVDQSAFSIEKLWRSEEVFYGKTFPLELDDLACDLNPTVCTRELIPAQPAQGEYVPSLTAHVSGFLPSRTQWRPQPSMSLLIPDVRLASDIEWFAVQKDAHTSVESIVVDELGGCEQFDDRCRKLLLFYNRTIGDKLFDAAYSGSIALPVLTLVVSTNVRSATEIPGNPNAPPPIVTTDSQITLQPVPESNLKSTESFKVLHGVEAQGNSGVGTPIQENNVLKQLNNNVLPKVTIAPFQESQSPQPGAAIYPQDVDGYRTDLDKLLAVPDTLRHMPFPSEFEKKISVGVIDSHIDDKHCAFQSGQIAVLNPSAVQYDSPAAKCDLRTDSNEQRDHGTHVTGIIASHFGNGASIVPVGLNPYAQIYSMEVNLAGLNDQSIGIGLKKLVQDHELKIVNVSFGYLLSAQNPNYQPTDVLEGPIAGLQGTTLFVAAAGNAGADKSYICDVRPACYDLPNVIAVAAIDRNQDKPTFLESNGKLGSNFGRRIHIAAVGKDVFSTLANGRYGFLSGTSQAAPQVAAVASLMISEYPNLLPVAIKNRLIYCSDMLETLRGKLFGGRLNAECALDGNSGRLQLDTASNVQHGKFQATSVFHFVDGDNNVDIPVYRMRSMSFDPMQLKYTVFYTPRRGADAPLLSASNLELRSDPPQEDLRFNFEGGGGVLISVKQITRYVSPMSQ
jgi:subtilisin family serine protease